MSFRDFLLLFGGGQIVLLGLVGWLGKLWLDRILERERHARQTELEQIKSGHQLDVSSQVERLRAEFSQQQAMLAGSIAASSSAGAFGQKERLRAIERMWGAARCQRNAAAAAITYWDLIYAFDPEALTPKGQADLAAILEPIKFTQRCEKEDEEAENLRPFLGQELWSLYYGYRMLIWRAAIPLAISLQGNTKPEALFEDRDVVRLIGQVLTKDELAEFTRVTFQRLRWLLSRFEAHIMATSSLIISGQQAARESLSQSSDILAAAYRLEDRITERERHV